MTKTHFSVQKAGLPYRYTLLSLLLLPIVGAASVNTSDPPHFWGGTQSTSLILDNDGIYRLSKPSSNISLKNNLSYVNPSLDLELDYTGNNDIFLSNLDCSLELIATFGGD